MAVSNTISKILNLALDYPKSKVQLSNAQLTGFMSHCLGQSISEGGGKGCYLGMWSARSTGLESRGRIEGPATGRYRAEIPVQQMNSK